MANLVSLYSRFDALSPFLQTLSYHHIGSIRIAQRLAAVLPPQLSWCLLDAGCGEGWFTAHLLAELAELKILPRRIVAFDPDEMNLSSYAQRLSAFNLPLELHRETLQSWSAASYSRQNVEVILASHSLYEPLESDEPSAECKSKQMIHFLCNVPTLGAIATLASRRSEAYLVKRALLDALRKPDPSAFIEDLHRHLLPCQASIGFETFFSVMDMSSLLHEQKPEPLRKWCSYFSRSTDAEIAGIDVGRIKALIRAHTHRLGDLMEKGHSEFGSHQVNDRTIPLDHDVLLHCEGAIYTGGLGRL